MLGYSPTPLQGLVALSAAFLVALKQLVPEHTVSLFRNTVRIRLKHFPALFTLANIISGPLLGTDTALWLSLTGFLTSWVYLRFFRLSDVTGGEGGSGGGGVMLRGDASDTFAFIAFFPDAVHPFLSPITNTIYDLLVQLKICTPFAADDVETGTASRSAGLPGVMRSKDGARGAEAERRRAVALRALDERLNAAAAANRTVSAPGVVAGPAASVDAPEHAAGTSTTTAGETTVP